jgi:trans-aconitate 2-methyltransferase
LRNRNNGSWDARTYDQVSRLVQYRWGQQVLEWRKWRGDEIVMDAGCGSGLLTRRLAKRVPRGKVYAVDIDSNMIKRAKNNLQFFDNVEIIQSSFTDIRIPRKLDVVFSNSALHWIQDHRKVFQKFWEMLNPMNVRSKNNDISISSNDNNNSESNGQLLIQCGGDGNLQRIISMLERITHLDQFKEYFTDWKQPWYFAKPDDTYKLLQETGYVIARVFSSSDCVILPNRRVYSKFVKTVVLKSYLEHLSRDNDNPDIDKLKKLFLDVFLGEVEKCGNNNSSASWLLDFVRLNIIAQRS